MIAPLNVGMGADDGVNYSICVAGALAGEPCIVELFQKFG
jgi:hypothetical protein